MKPWLQCQPRSSSLRCIPSDEFSLLEGQCGGCASLVGWITISQEQPSNGGAQFRADLFLDGPVGCGIPAHNLNKVVSDLFESVAAEFNDGRVVRADRVVEGQLVISQAEFGAARLLLFLPVCQVSELGHDCSCVQGVVLVAQ